MKSLPLITLGAAIVAGALLLTPSLQAQDHSQHKSAASKPASRAASRPASRPASKPASKPTSKPASKPASRPAKTTSEKVDASKDYTCPMHLHISKSDFMRCPECGMHLVPRDSISGDHDHDHDTYSCPMHPDVVTDAAGRCPLCGMDLELKEKVEPSAPAAQQGAQILRWTMVENRASVSAKKVRVPVYAMPDKGGVIKIDPLVVQNMGVRVAPARREPLFRHIRTLGTVDVAEDELAVVNLRFSGWIEKLYVDETGVKVKRGQVLAEVYSPELLSAQEEYLLALRSRAPDDALVVSARRRLEFFGMGSSDLRRLDASQKALRTIRIRAPREGYVLHKDVVLGARVSSGKDIFRIGNLQKIWINAEVYEFDAAWVEVGQPATMELSYQEGKTYSGTVSYVYPTLNMKSRTLTVRLEFDNPGLALKPGMFATLRIEARRKEGALAIPTEAIIHSGERQIAFVALGQGHYEKREIVTGLVGDRHRTEVQSGILEGERVVVSGQFLLDSESQLQEAVQKFRAARLETLSPGVAPEKSGKADSDDDSYFTCPMHPHIVSDHEGTCPICGMDLVEKKGS